MGPEIEAIEARFKSFISQLQTENVVLDRIVYKNKNKHRKCLYFQYMLKVRRDIKLLHSAGFEEILASCFIVINGDKPNREYHLLQSLKRRKCDSGKYNFMEKLLGVARLLSQMSEPILKAACEISVVLARVHFPGFSITVLALLARIRILVQQMLLDVVSVFNMISSVSRKPHCFKITTDGPEVFREYFPTKGGVVSLECLWETDKFVLFEKMEECENKAAISSQSSPFVEVITLYDVVGEICEYDGVVVKEEVEDEEDVSGGCNNIQSAGDLFLGNNPSSISNNAVAYLSVKNIPPKNVINN